MVSVSQQHCIIHDLQAIDDPQYERRKMRPAYWAYQILSIPSTFSQNVHSLPDWPADSRSNVFAVPGCNAAGKPRVMLEQRINSG